MSCDLEGKKAPFNFNNNNNDEGPQQELPRQQAWVADFAGNRPIDRVRNKNSALRTEMALRREVAPEESL